MSTPQFLRHQCPCPCSEPQLPSTSPGDPQRSAGRSGPGSYAITAFSPGVHNTLCAPSKSGVSVSHSPVEFRQSSPTGLQSQMFWGLLLLMPDLQSGEPDMGLRTLIPSHCSFFFVFGSRISFSVWVPVFFIDGCSAISCDFVLFVRGGELRSFYFYSAILSLV